MIGVTIEDRNEGATIARPDGTIVEIPSGIGTKAGMVLDYSATKDTLWRGDVVAMDRQIIPHDELMFALDECGVWFTGDVSESVLDVSDKMRIPAPCASALVWDLIIYERSKRGAS